MKYAFYIYLLMLLLSCDRIINRDDKSILTDETIGEPIQRASTEVAYMTASKSSFISKVFLQGNVEAREKTRLRSELGGVIRSLAIVDGDAINKGTVILNLDDRELNYQLAQNQLDLTDAVFKKRERLIMDGGEADDDLSVTPEKLKIIHTVSGYDKAQQAIQYTKFLIDRLTLVAPLDGIIADVKVNQFDMINPGEEICTIINPSSYEARFLVVEDLALSMKKGQAISIHPINDPSKRVKAKVDVINPVVNANGLVEIRAKLSNHRYRFFENMNIRVILEQSIPHVIVVPKEALVKRSGKDVVFIYDEEEQRAKWKYVTVADENDTDIATSEGLESGDKVIIKGNLNLDHDAIISVMDSIDLD